MCNLALVNKDFISRSWYILLHSISSVGLCLSILFLLHHFTVSKPCDCPFHHLSLLWQLPVIACDHSVLVMQRNEQFDFVILIFCVVWMWWESDGWYPCAIAVWGECAQLSPETNCIMSHHEQVRQWPWLPQINADCYTAPRLWARQASITNTISFERTHALVTKGGPPEDPIPEQTEFHQRDKQQGCGLVTVCPCIRRQLSS